MGEMYLVGHHPATLIKDHQSIIKLCYNKTQHNFCSLAREHILNTLKKGANLDAHVPPHVTVPLCAHAGKGSCLHCITHYTNNHFFCAVFLFCFIRVSVKTRKRHTTDVSGEEVRSLATTRKGLSAQSNLRYKLFSLTSES